MAAPVLDVIESDTRFRFPESMPQVYLDWDWKGPGQGNISSAGLSSLSMLYANKDPEHERDMHFCIAVWTGLRRYRASFLADNLAEETARANCRFCSDTDRRRDAWGLFLHPASRPGTYYCVGIFVSRAEQAGDSLFQGANLQTVELI